MVRVLTDSNWLLVKGRTYPVRTVEDGKVIVNDPLYPTVQPTLLEGEYEFTNDANVKG